MKRIFASLLALALTVSLAACGAAPAEEPDGSQYNLVLQPSVSGCQSEADTAKRIRFLVGENEIIVRLEDNPAAESLYAMLPMELNFEDYSNTEKIAYPDEALTTDGAPDRCTPQRGDLCFYAPWGNLCFFYRDFRESPSLVPLGTVESGVEYLESLNTVASVTAEAVG